MTSARADEHAGASNAALERAVAAVRSRLPDSPSVGLVLGSGLGTLVDGFQDARRIRFDEIPSFRTATVAGHGSVLAGGILAGVPCIALQGRLHAYEGHAASTLAFPVRVLIALGIRALIVTNAAGALNRTFKAGDLMIIDDHVNLLWRNPLIGQKRDGETRFPDMSEPYDHDLRRLAERVALESGIRTVRGVYCAVTGSSYETAAEVRMLARMGADAVGMSTIPEVLVARAAAIPVLGISVITNPAAGLLSETLDHAAVIAAGTSAAGDVARLVRGVIARSSEFPIPDSRIP